MVRLHTYGGLSSAESACRQTGPTLGASRSKSLSSRFSWSCAVPDDSVLFQLFFSLTIPRRSTVTGFGCMSSALI